MSNLPGEQKRREAREEEDLDGEPFDPEDYDEEQEAIADKKIKLYNRRKSSAMKHTEARLAMPDHPI